jgi:sister-chromatid-cohesion protein PDS5
MSRSKAAAAATAVESEEEEEEERPAGGLQFNEPLSWRPASKPSTGELLRRLTALATELKDMDQEEADRDALTKPAKDLAHSNLLQHKDKGVRAWTACCLADIFRICAPEAPFTAPQLKVGQGHSAGRMRLTMA